MDQCVVAGRQGTIAGWQDFSTNRLKHGQ